ncbi:polygalacturonase QRT2-like [Typha angustifolia]|uniref:polygalacturonase QRT2-like n=1 Tax=Typha angustifolia TaxID=59011 RepID=UPI003C2B8A90
MASVLSSFLDLCYFAIKFLWVVCSLMAGVINDEYETPTPTPTPKVFDVIKFGAVGDGKNDDTKAFAYAWAAACTASSCLPTLFVPGNKKYYVEQIVFDGPCSSNNVTVQIEGTIVAPEKPSAWNGKKADMWLKFDSVNGLTFHGSGLIDGRGSNWWNQSCKRNPKMGCTTTAPTAIRFVHCNDLVVRNMMFMNSPQTHVTIENSDRVRVSSLNITANATSPNTDGIHIQASQNVVVFNTTIATGDDCISIGDRSSNLLVKNCTCGPGHGMSIGSLGKGGSNASVENIHISYTTIFNTTNGARIKTWQGATGFARSITFDHITLTNVKNPIIINQYYCDSHSKCPIQKDAVQISNVTFSNFWGTSMSKVAVALNCSTTVPCTGIKIEEVNITSTDTGDSTEAACINAHGWAQGCVNPKVSCLSR